MLMQFDKCKLVSEYSAQCITWWSLITPHLSHEGMARLSWPALRGWLYNEVVNPPAYTYPSHS